MGWKTPNLPEFDANFIIIVTYHTNNCYFFKLLHAWREEPIINVENKCIWLILQSKILTLFFASRSRLMSKLENHTKIRLINKLCFMMLDTFDFQLGEPFLRPISLWGAGTYFETSNIYVVIYLLYIITQWKTLPKLDITYLKY